MAFEVFKKIRRHWPVILMALVLGFLTAFPFFHFQSALGDRYNGVLNQVINDDVFYMARIKDALDGHLTLGNAYLWEHKDKPPQQLFLPEWLLAQPLKLFNLDIVQGRILYSFILPIFAFLLAYLAFYLIHPSRLWACLFAVFLFFGVFLLNFTRPVIPQFVFLFWLSQFILLWQLIKKPSNRTIKLLNILNFGLLFYIYPFYWTFYLVFLAVLAFLCFFKDRFLSKQLLKVMLGGLLIGSVYLYLTFLAGRLPEHQETLTRLQMVFSRSPSEIKSVSLAAAALVLIWVLYRFKAIKMDGKTIFFIAGAFSVLAVTNQNIVTGLKIEAGHYRMSAAFFFAFAIYYLLIRMNWSRMDKFRFLIASLAVIVAVNGVFDYLKMTTKVSQEDVYAQRYAAVFDWLNKNTPKDSVVYADNNLSELIPVYTSNNVFYTRAANLFFISDQEVLERFILNNYFEKFDRDFVIKNVRSIYGVRYIDNYGHTVQKNKLKRFLGLKPDPEIFLPDDAIDKVLRRAKEIQQRDLVEELKRFRMDYLVWDQRKNPHWLIPGSFKKVFEINQFVIFKFN